MTLSKRGDYVVRAALCLARAYASGEPRKIREVVAEMDVPLTYASQILSDLVRAELAVSKAGKGGGYRLVRPPEQVTLLEVVEAGEGPLRSERCALGDGPCRWNAVCPVHETWGAATAALRGTLAETSLATLVARDEALEAGTYVEPADSHRHGGPVMVIEDWVQVEVDAEEAWRRLATAESWLPGCVLASYTEAETIRKSLDAPHLTWIPHAVTVLASPNHATAELATTDERELRVLWEAGGVKGPSSRFEGKLTVRHIDPERAEFQLRGVFRAPFQALQNDPALTEKLSRVTVRSALRQMAQVIEQAPGSSNGGALARAH
ncbi:MAG: Rrf2 family transcriptional regulator [Actinomycetota bacterium]|nr:Rrf2 family transcriptional regulator [Actinomycetota bacterium]